MKRLFACALAAAFLLVPLGCHVHGVGKPHPHGAPPGQVKKAMYRCGGCKVIKDFPGSCHGKVMIKID